MRCKGSLETILSIFFFNLSMNVSRLVSTLKKHWEPRPQFITGIRVTLSGGECIRCWREILLTSAASEAGSNSRDFIYCPWNLCGVSLQLRALLYSRVLVPQHPISRWQFLHSWFIQLFFFSIKFTSLVNRLDRCVF